MVSVHKHCFHRKDAKNAEISFNENTQRLCVYAVSSVLYVWMQINQGSTDYRNRVSGIHLIRTNIRRGDN